MKSIRELSGSGIGKKILIIGGGCSAGQFDYERLGKDFVLMTVNDSMYDFKSGKYFKGIKPDFLIYNDISAIREIKKMKIPGTKIIGFGNHHFPGCSYLYRLSEVGGIDSTNTGLKALMIAKNIMQFDEIYLIGFDFKTRKTKKGKERSHFNGDRVGKNEKYLSQAGLDHHIATLESMPKEFEVLQDREGIFNCYKHSRLTLFQFGMPY